MLQCIKCNVLIYNNKRPVCAYIQRPKNKNKKIRQTQCKLYFMVTWNIVQHNIKGKRNENYYYYFHSILQSCVLSLCSVRLLLLICSFHHPFIHLLIVSNRCIILSNRCISVHLFHFRLVLKTIYSISVWC